MDLNIAGLRVVVTAGADGIGRKAAEAFLREGANVFVCDTSSSALEEFARTHPSVGICKCDVADEAGVSEMISKAADFLGGIDCLINNAGITGPTAPAATIVSEDWNRCIAVNLSGTFYCSREAIPYLKKSTNASIISMSSVAGKMGYPNKSPYVAAKWGLIGLMKTLSIELGADGIRCNAILPGPVEGPRIRGVIADKAALAGISAKEQEQRYLALASIKSFVTPEEVAEMLLYLSSTKSRRISGQAISIDGDTQALV